MFSLSSPRLLVISLLLFFDIFFSFQDSVWILQYSQGDAAVVTPPTISAFGLPPSQQLVDLEFYKSDHLLIVTRPISQAEQNEDVEDHESSNGVYVGLIQLSNLEKYPLRPVYPLDIEEFYHSDAVLSSFLPFSSHLLSFSTAFTRQATMLREAQSFQKAASHLKNEEFHTLSGSHLLHSTSLSHSQNMLVCSIFKYPRKESPLYCHQTGSAYSPLTLSYWLKKRKRKRRREREMKRKWMRMRTRKTMKREMKENTILRNSE